MDEKSEYETQHFGFSVNTIQNENKAMIKKKLETVTKNCVENIINNLQPSPGIAHELRCSAGDVTKHIFESVKTNLKEFDSLFEKYFTIPENILLPQDHNHKNPNIEHIEIERLQKLNSMKKYYEQNFLLYKKVMDELAIYKQHFNDNSRNEHQIIHEIENLLSNNLEEEDISVAVKKLEDISKGEDVKLYLSKYNNRNN